MILTPLLFMISMTISYGVPYALDCPTYVSWLAVNTVYLADMDLSRQLYPDEMNTPEITVSEQMSYAGMASATAMGILSLLPINIPPPLDFVAYFIAGSAIYAIWSNQCPKE